MNAPADTVQIIHDAHGKPAFVVIPYEQYVGGGNSGEWIPHGVISRVVDGATPIRAWREHLGLTQAEAAGRLGIFQPAYAQQGNTRNPRRRTRERIAAAFGISAEQLDV